MKKKGIIFFLAAMAAGLTMWTVVFQMSKSKRTCSQHQVFLKQSPEVLDAIPKKKADEPNLDALAGQLPCLPDKPVRKRQTHDQSSVKAPAHTKEQVLTQAEEEEIYLRAQVFRDEALETFPVYSVEIHRPNSMDPGWVEENGIMVEKSYGPAPDEIWIRIKPENARQMREIMAQMADLYQTYAGIYGRNVRIVNWVGGQAWAAFTYHPGAETVH